MNRMLDRWKIFGFWAAIWLEERFSFERIAIGLGIAIGMGLEQYFGIFSRRY
jgi:hypothetical protein